MHSIFNLPSLKTPYFFEYAQNRASELYTLVARFFPKMDDSEEDSDIKPQSVQMAVPIPSKPPSLINLLETKFDETRKDVDELFSTIIRSFESEIDKLFKQLPWLKVDLDKIKNELSKKSAEIQIDQIPVSVDTLEALKNFQKLKPDLKIKPLLKLFVEEYPKNLIAISRENEIGPTQLFDRKTSEILKKLIALLEKYPDTGIYEFCATQEFVKLVGQLPQYLQNSFSAFLSQVKEPVMTPKVQTATFFFSGLGIPTDFEEEPLVVDGEKQLVTSWNPSCKQVMPFFRQKLKAMDAALYHQGLTKTAIVQFFQDFWTKFPPIENEIKENKLELKIDEDTGEFSISLSGKYVGDVSGIKDGILKIANGGQLILPQTLKGRLDLESGLMVFEEGKGFVINKVADLKTKTIQIVESDKFHYLGGFGPFELKTEVDFDFTGFKTLLSSNTVWKKSSTSVS